MNNILSTLGLTSECSGVFDGGQWLSTPSGETLQVTSPVNGQPLASVATAGEAEYERVVQAAIAGFRRWRRRPAPQRGEVVRQIGEALRRNKEALGALVSLEMGKIRAEGEGEVQEMIDICDFAVGLSRQLYGCTMQSERPDHRMYEQWQPLGPVGVITAFNFPVAVWSWNAAIAAVCGNSVIWKPSEKTPLCAIAVQKIVERVMQANELTGVFTLAVGDATQVGQRLAADARVPLISATGSTAMGKAVAPVVAARLGRALLELGGNNALLVTQGADLDLVVRATVFGAAGTAGQRCTTTRRLLVERPAAKELVPRLVEAYRQLRVGDPLDPQTHVGPLIDHRAVAAMQAALKTAETQGCQCVYGGEPLSDLPSDCYVRPAIVRAPLEAAIVRQETFAPILYIQEADSIDALIAANNSVPQGLSSAMFTLNLRHAERFLSAEGSDCGIANINIGTSGAEIGGAFGGEKDTGGGREAGSDAWKAYMRRQTVTINWGEQLPLAQGIRFGAG